MIITVQLEFTSGTQCDILEGTNRTSTVDIYCGNRYSSEV
jgi:hypothetical protein